MADVVCPECGAAAKIDFSGKMYCLGLLTATADLVYQAEQALKVAVSNGDPIRELDAKFRALSAQHVCGLQFTEDPAGSGNWKRYVPNI